MILVQFNLVDYNICYIIAQFNPSRVNYYQEVNRDLDSRTISFTWNPFNISMCPAIPYNILTSNCGSCPTTTNHTAVTCTEVPIDATYCSFALIPTICGGISPNLNVLLNVQLKGIPHYLNLKHPYFFFLFADSNKSHSDLIAACVFLTIIIVALLILIGIALLFRFKDYIKRAFHFQFEIPL